MFKLSTLPTSLYVKNSPFALPGEAVGYLLTDIRLQEHVVASIDSSYWIKLLFPRAQGIKGFCYQ